MGTLNIVRLHKLYDKVRAPLRSVEAVRVEPLLSGNAPYVFHRVDLHCYRSAVASLLSQLPDSMMQSKSEFCCPWIQARYNFQSNQWAILLEDADLLLAMGRALQMVSVQVPDYPCTLPYVQILDIDASRAERLISNRSRLSHWDYSYLRKENVSKLPRKQKQTTYSLMNIQVMKNSPNGVQVT